jgi:magnesium transporter
VKRIVAGIDKQVLPQPPAVPTGPAVQTPGDTAAHLMSTAVLRVRAHDTVGGLRATLRQRAGRTGEHGELVCLVDDSQCPLGMLSAQALLALDDARPLGDAALRPLPRVAAGTDQERVASAALHDNAAAVAVIDDDGALLGVVGPAELLRILREEHVEDLHRLAGIARETRRARQAIDAPPLRRARHRLPWLVVGLLGSIVATWVMSRFEQTLTLRPAIGFFVPALVYLADAIGTQSEAVAVRGLSLSHASFARLLGGELRTGLLIGATLALITWPLVGLAFGDWRLAGAVAGALAGASALATGIGIALPWLLARAGLDPAYGSGPLATVIQDVLTLLVYFAAVTAAVA